MHQQEIAHVHMGVASPSHPRRCVCAAHLVHLVSPNYNASFCAGIINSEGRLWKSQRRFLHDKLREFGMTYLGNGKKVMEGRIKVGT